MPKSPRNITTPDVEEDTKLHPFMFFWFLDTTCRGTPRSRRRRLEDKPYEDMQKKPEKHGGRRRTKNWNQRSRVNCEGPPPRKEEEGKSWTTVTPEKS